MDNTYMVTPTSTGGPETVQGLDYLISILRIKLHMPFSV